MNYATIKWTDIANGEGVRVSLFVSGCTHKCKNCFNQIAWDFDYGELFTPEVEEKIFQELSSPFIAGISLLGGEPFEPENQIVLLNLIKKFKERFPEKNIWMYTGYVLEKDLLPGQRKHVEGVTELILDSIDTLVDGPFILAERNLSLKFRGSNNQRLLDKQQIQELRGKC